LAPPTTSLSAWLSRSSLRPCRTVSWSSASSTRITTECLRPETVWLSRAVVERRRQRLVVGHVARFPGVVVLFEIHTNATHDGVGAKHLLPGRLDAPLRPTHEIVRARDRSANRRIAAEERRALGRSHRAITIERQGDQRHWDKPVVPSERHGQACDLLGSESGSRCMTSWRITSDCCRASFARSNS